MNGDVLRPEFPDSPEWAGVDEVCTLRDMYVTGATYRQIDYWTRCGYFEKADGDEPDVLNGTGKGPARKPGSGQRRTWTGREQRIAHIMVALSRVGIVGALAADLARDSVDQGVHEFRTEDGVVVKWDVVA